MPDSLSFQIGRYLTDNAPLAFCDACVALRLKESLADARDAAIILGRAGGFMRTSSACYGCSRTAEMTVLVAA